jgi:hypothetical protein
MFTWDEKPSSYRRGPERRREMFRKEIEDRAALLLRLGYAAKDVKARLAKSVDWDFDLQEAPDYAGEVGRIVDDVFKRNRK